MDVVEEVIDLSDTEPTGAVATNSQVADGKHEEEVQQEFEEGSGDITAKEELPDETASGKNDDGAAKDEPDDDKPTNQENVLLINI